MSTTGTFNGGFSQKRDDFCYVANTISVGGPLSYARQSLYGSYFSVWGTKSQSITANDGTLAVAVISGRNGTPVKSSGGASAISYSVPATQSLTFNFSVAVSETLIQEVTSAVFEVENGAALSVTSTSLGAVVGATGPNRSITLNNVGVIIDGVATYTVVLTNNTGAPVNVVFFSTQATWLRKNVRDGYAEYDQVTQATIYRDSATNAIILNPIFESCIEQRQIGPVVRATILDNNYNIVTVDGVLTPFYNEKREYVGYITTEGYLIRPHLNNATMWNDINANSSIEFVTLSEGGLGGELTIGTITIQNPTVWSLVNFPNVTGITVTLSVSNDPATEFATITTDAGSVILNRVGQSLSISTETELRLTGNFSVSVTGAATRAQIAYTENRRR